MNKLPFANKSLGQHFLKENKIIDLIVSDYVEEADAILEIGPGPGILTEKLSQSRKPIHVIEKDKRFPELLEKFLEPTSIHNVDVLECNLDVFCTEYFATSKHLWLVSNLPYNVGSLILIKALQTQAIQYMSLMFQREVADKVFSFDTRKNKSMNSLMALSQTYFDVKLLTKVAPGCFAPPPKVDSAVLSFERRREPRIPLSRFSSFETFLRQIFKFKRKQLGSVLKGHFAPEEIEQTLKNLGLERSVRAESLGLTTIQDLYLNLRKA